MWGEYVQAVRGYIQAVGGSTYRQLTTCGSSVGFLSPSGTASLPTRSGLPGSLTPFSGTASIFADNPMLELSVTSRVPIASVGKYFPEKYLLSHLISGVAPQGGPEEIAKEWLDQMVKNMRNRQNVRVEAKCNMPNELRNVQPFAQNDKIRPDVTVTKDGLMVRC